MGVGTEISYHYEESDWDSTQGAVATSDDIQRELAYQRARTLSTPHRWRPPKMRHHHNLIAPSLGEINPDMRPEIPIYVATSEMK